MSVLPSAKLLMQGARKLRPQDVFATSLYTGNGGTQTITNGLNLAGKGGLVWGKNRGANSSHHLQDTVRGAGGTAQLSSNTSISENSIVSPTTAITSFGANGVSISGTSSASDTLNAPGASHVLWSFRRAKKFFDIVTYTGNGQSGRQIPHGLGAAYGMAIIKRLDVASNWKVYHRGTRGIAHLNSTDAFAEDSDKLADGFPGNGTDTFFNLSTIGNLDAVNATGGRYVAYLFAHNPDLIDCGSYVGNGQSAGPSVTCGKGWRPQWIMVKQATGQGNSWNIVDVMRGLAPQPSDYILRANTAQSEIPFNGFSLTNAGFLISGSSGDNNNAGQTYIYLTIRSPT